MESLDVETKRERLALSTIRSSPFQPRGEFAQEELEELAESIKQVGLLHPIVVRPIRMTPTSEPLYYELISGERRWRAVTLAGFSHIEATVVDISDEKAAKIALIENVQRVDLNPLEVAAALKKLIDVFAMSQEEVSQRVGKKRSTVANYLRLLNLPQDIQARLSANEITMGHAKAILSLSSDELKQRLSELIVKDKMSVRATEMLSQKMAREDKKSVDRSDEIEQIRKSLSELFATKIDITINTAKAKGKIHLHFFSTEDLERLLEKMGLDLTNLH